MEALKQLTPKEAAEFLLEDILKKQGNLNAIAKEIFLQTDFAIGNYVCYKIYGTPLEGRCDIISKSFEEKISKPLGFSIVTEGKYDVPDIEMLKHLGKLISKNNY